MQLHLIVCSFELPRFAKLSRQDFFQEFLVVLKYYGIENTRISSIEKQRVNLYSNKRKQWLESLWNKHYTLLYDWKINKIAIHPRETLQWSQIKAIYSFYLELDLRLNMNRKKASAAKDSIVRKRARVFQSILKEFSNDLSKQHLHQELISEESPYEVASDDINRFLLRYARDYIINLTSLTLSHSLSLAAQTYRQNFALSVPTFKQYRKVYAREVFTRLWPFDLNGQLERQLDARKLTNKTFVLLDGKKIRSRDTIFMRPELRFKVLELLLPRGTARTSTELISNLEKMSIAYHALLKHRKELLNKWNKNNDPIKGKKKQERLIKLLTGTEEEE